MDPTGWRNWRGALVIAVWGVVLVKLVLSLGNEDTQWWHNDLLTLWRDQKLFYAGTYPHMALDPAASGRDEVRTAYPPMSFPLFLPWLPPGLALWGTRVWFAVGQLAALGALVAFAWRRGREVDRRLGWLLAGTIAAMSGVRADLLFGNMALITTALLLGALLALERGRGAGAAAAWLGAMVKPQMGWLFAVTLWRRGAWRPGLGAALLFGASGVAACAWTGVSFTAALRVGSGEEVAKWASWSTLNNLPVWLGHLGGSPHAALLAGAVVALLAAAWVVSRPALRHDLLGQFAVVGLINRVCVYHNYCDDVLLVFALVWLGRRAWTRGGKLDGGVFAAVSLSVWLPATTLTLPVKLAVLLVWSAAAVWIAVAPAETQRNEPS